jgi:ABC-type lipoprotein export system ATPase subunit
MKIEEYINLLLDKYDLNYIYKKFLLLSIISTIIKESFYWLLLHFSNKVAFDPSLIKKYAIYLIVAYTINIPAENIFNKIKNELIKELKIASTNYFNNKVINVSKTNVLNINMVEYYDILEAFNNNLEEHILNEKNKIDFPIRCVTLYLVAKDKRFNLLIFLTVLFYILVYILNENKLTKEQPLIKKYFKYENIIRNYLINNKNYIINNEINEKYLNNNVSHFEDISKEIADKNATHDTKVNIILLFFVLIVINSRYDTINQNDFLYYFLIVYDIESVANKLNEYYKSKINYTKMQERLNYLNDFKDDNLNIKDNIKINNIIINDIKNIKPKIQLMKSININNNDHILVDGESGSGKSTLLYILKGIVIPDSIDIYPPLNSIKSRTFISLPNHKGLYDGYLYDIITNYNNNINTELINYALEQSKFNIKTNDMILIEKLSSGERVRLLITRLIYTIKNSNNYDILLFDEIDENLNETLAVEICNNIRKVFNDKIILYITHNNKVKTLFKKKIIVNNGIVN